MVTQCKGPHRLKKLICLDLRPLLPPAEPSRPQVVQFDSIILGGGVYGARLALALRADGESVLLLEREPVLLGRASLVNQARVHNGYHYPRSILTSVRSRQNYDRFRADYADCAYDRFDHYYAIARNDSKTTAAQFLQFCKRVGAPRRRRPTAFARSSIRPASRRSSSCRSARSTR